MKQIGDKETEMKTLIDTSPKQLWTTDLDAFVLEWHTQLEDEAKRAKKIASLGRRASQKLRIGTKGGAKKRKNDDSEDSDAEFAAPSKAVVVPKTKSSSSLFSFLSKPLETEPAAKPVHKPLISTVTQAPISKPPAVRAGLLKSEYPGSGSDVEMVDIPKASIAAKAHTTAGAAAKTKSQPRKKLVADDRDDEDVFVAVAKEAAAQKEVAADATKGRVGRAVSRQPVKYAESDESFDDNSLLDDVSHMVKGLPTTIGTSAAAAAKPLFSNTARPSSSAGFAATKTKLAKSFADSDMEDETDYKALVPRGSPDKPAARNARGVLVTDDEDDSFGVVPAMKPATVKASVAQAKKSTNAAQLKKPAAAPPKVVEKKSATLSPAAKAYAAKKAKADLAAAKSSAAPKPAAAKKKKVVLSDDDDEDVDALVNDILTDNDSDATSAPKSRATAVAARPSRRAAATAAKSKYVVDDEDDSLLRDDDEGSADDFDDNDDSE